MSRGYLCIAQNNKHVDYLTQAYALALSLRLTQRNVSDISVCVDPETKSKITNKHRQVFDHIIDIPWSDDAKNSEWKIQNKWKYLYMTPYEETVILDTDMIFPVDVSYWWEFLTQRDVWATTNVRTYRGEIVTSDYYRKFFVANNLPNVYTAFFYFKKSELASELFAMIRLIFQNWQRFFHKYMPAGKPEHLSGDVAFALAMQILGIESECTMNHLTNAPTFVHMKSHIQNFSDTVINEDWTQTVPTYFKRCSEFKIGNFQQLLPFHYVEKSWMSTQLLEKIENDYYN
jgi:hypothetical protein